MPDSDSTIHSVRRLLFSHHPPQHSNRTVMFCFGRYKFRVCSRCLGLVVGFLTVIILFLTVKLPVSDKWFVMLLIPLCPIPAIVDFHGQLMDLWESTNPRRILTGMILGTGVSLSVLQVSAGNYLFAVVIPCIIGLYFTWVALNLQRIASMQRHLCMYARYFERCRCEDARRAVCNILKKKTL